MSFLKYSDIVLCLIVINYCSYDIQTQSTDDKFKKLEACLTSAGTAGNDVYGNDVHKYAELNWQWNTLNGDYKPMAYLVVNNVSDVQNAVICCKSLKVRIVPRGGGHSYVKNSFGDSQSLILDMSRMNEISVDPIQMVSVVGAGAKNGLINYMLSKSSVFISTGICPSVGVVGFALGGGYGYYTRKYGLTSDSIIELEMVDAKGKLLLINNSTNMDLYWALRGAGGGNYGIVTKLKFTIYTAPATIVYGAYEFSFDDFSQFFESWQYLVMKTEFKTHNLGTIVVMSATKIKMEIFYINVVKEQKTSVDDLIRFVSQFAFPKYSERFVEEMTHREFLLKISQPYSDAQLTDPLQLANLTKHNQVGWKKVKSFYVPKIINKNEINELLPLLGTYLKVAKVAFLQNGGAMTNFSRLDTAFVHRDSYYDVQMFAYRAKVDKKVETRVNYALKTFYEKSKKLLNHKESYQNYLDQDITDHLDRYYKENLKTLIKIKMNRDPENLFHHSHSIPTK